MITKEVIKTENLSKVFHIGHDEIHTIFSTIRYKLSGENPKKDLWALKDISISINKGEMIAIIGPNGAGKTTLLRVLSGIMKETSGTYKISEKVSTIFELGLGFNPRFTALYNVYLYGAIHGLSRKQINNILPKIIEFSGLEDFMGAKLREFSSGMRQRLAFATIIQTVEGIVMADEVLAVGDQSFKKKCFSYFRSLLKADKTVLFVTHGLDPEVRELCSRALYINKGEAVYYGEVGEALRIYNEYCEENDKNC